MTRLRSRTTARLAAGAATICLVGLAAAGAASAHVDPTPAAVQAGTSATVTFNVEHGCNGSPTVKLEMQLPSGLTAVSAPDMTGWKAVVTATTVTWTGGPLDATTPADFALTFTAPTTPGSYEFPVVQSCTSGSNKWIEKSVEGQPEPEFPAPVILVTKDKPTPEQATPPTDAPDTTVAGATGTTVAAKSSSSSHTGAIVGGIIAAVVVLGGAGYALTRKKGPKPPAAS